MKPDSAVLLTACVCDSGVLPDDVHHEIGYRQNKWVQSISLSFAHMKIYY
jgi:hypothetical protein